MPTTQSSLKMRLTPSAHGFNGEAYATAVLAIAFVPNNYRSKSIQIVHILLLPCDLRRSTDGAMCAMLVTATADFERPKWQSLS